MAQKLVTLTAPHSKSRSWKMIFVEIVNAILILTWLHTGISKLITHVAFYIQMQQSAFFHQYPMFFSYAAPILEIVIALLLIIRKTRRLGMFASFLLMAFFSFYVAYLMVKLPSLPCSCGGVVSWMNWPQHLAFNISLTILSFMALLILHRQAKAAKKS